MSNIIRIKRRASGGAAGAPATLSTAELAFNETDSTLYIGYGDTGSGVATSVRAIAGDGAYVTLTGTQTITGEKTFGAIPLISAALSTSDNSTKVATTQFVKSQGYLLGNELITVSGDATGSGTNSLVLTLATVNASVGTFTKVTVDAKGRVTSATTLSASDIPTLTASKISDFDTQVRTNPLNLLAVPTGNVSLNSFKLTNLAEPTSDQDAATKGYVDAVATGLDVKDSVRVATTANVSLGAAPLVVDGITLVQGNRVLVKNQTAAEQNGIYVVTTAGTGANGVWSRANDFAGSATVTAGAFTFVEEGAANADSGWVLTTDNPIVVGTTPLIFAQFSGAGQVVAGDGLVKVGNIINVGEGTGLQVNADTVQLAGQALALHQLATDGLVVRTGAGTVAARTLTGTSNRVTITNGDGIAGNPTLDIASTYVGQASITTLGTISTGVWQGTAVGLAYGGTGANLSATADGSIYKKSGTALVTATAGVDYLNDQSTINGGTF